MLMDLHNHASNPVEIDGIWESVFNPAFNYGGFAIIKSHAEFIRMGLPQSVRLVRLNQIAIRQLQSLTSGTKALKKSGAQ